VSRQEDFVLVVDDEMAVRQMLLSQLAYLGFTAHATEHPAEALSIAGGESPPALVLLDIEMPASSGLELLTQIKAIDDDIQVVMVSGLSDLATVRKCLRNGAYDYLAKPFELEDLHATAERALERRRLLRQNREYQQGLERMVDEQTVEIRRTRDIALLTLARLAESRDSEIGQHLERIAQYSGILAGSLRQGPYNGQVTDEFVERVKQASQLHDIGKVGIPDRVLLKKGPLTDDEWEVMRSHTTIGGDTLRSVLDRTGGPTELSMAMDIAYHHHERWDGDGYPGGLAEDSIPLPARIVTVADAYDAITSRRPYKQAYDHQEAVRRILVDKGTHFDPVLVDGFVRCQEQIESVHTRLKDYQSGIFRV
jgi:putative two-component system response regulator